MNNHSGEELLLQAVQQAVCAIAHAGVNGRWLDDGAARRDKPVKPLPLRELRDGAGAGVSLADARNGFEMLVDQTGIGVRPQGLECGL